MIFPSVTHTYVELEVSKQTYDEIRKKLADANYDHCFMDDGGIDMHGIAIISECTPSL